VQPHWSHFLESTQACIGVEQFCTVSSWAARPDPTQELLSRHVHSRDDNKGIAPRDGLSKQKTKDHTQDKTTEPYMTAENNTAKASNATSTIPLDCRVSTAALRTNISCLRCLRINAASLSTPR